MKLSLKIVLLIVLVIAFSVPAIGQTINVTFQANTATNLDTLGTDGFVEMRGAVNGAEGEIPGSGGQSISWSSSSTLEMTNVGGDYWSITFQMEPGDTLWYKFWTGFDENIGTIPDGGWEGPFIPADPIAIDTRTFVSGANDTIVPVQYYHPGGGNPAVPQFWKPFEEKPDSVAIYFRVNMAGREQLGLFDPDSLVGVRSGPPIGNVGWTESAEVPLTLEVNSVDSSFWSGTAYLPVATDTIQKYKFVYYNNGVQWESTPDREFNTTNRDTTLHWVWFSDEPPVPDIVTALLTFRVSTEAVEGLDLFDRGIEDKIYVIGPNGWDIPDHLIDMTFIPALQEWATTEQFTRGVGSEMTYKYFIRWDSSRVDPLSPNYIPNLIIRGINDDPPHDGEDSGWEEPSSTGGGNRSYTWTGDPQQVVGGEYGFDRHFFNSSPANSSFTTPMSITWNVNMQPATDPQANTNPHLFDPATDSVWVQFDGSLFALSQGWYTFGERAVLLEDPDGDMVYSGTYAVDPPGWFQMGYILAYNDATPGIYITNGGGTETGRRYYQFIHPDSLIDEGGQFPTSYWPASFTLPTIDWKQNDLTVATPPNMTVPTAIDDGDDPVARRFALEQNYPNPFNPFTTIRYELAKTTDVEILIYNITGQVVKTIVDAKQNTGTYTVQWNGTNNAGNRVASGIYFVRMKAGDFSKVRKMTLLR